MNDVLNPGDIVLLKFDMIFLMSCEILFDKFSKGDFFMIDKTERCAQRPHLTKIFLLTSSNSEVYTWMSTICILDYFEKVS